MQRPTDWNKHTELSECSCIDLVYHISDSCQMYFGAGEENGDTRRLTASANRDAAEVSHNTKGWIIHELSDVRALSASVRMFHLTSAKKTPLPQIRPNGEIKQFFVGGKPSSCSRENSMRPFKSRQIRLSNEHRDEFVVPFPICRQTLSILTCIPKCS